jgi:hypothetical protein
VVNVIIRRRVASRLVLHKLAWGTRLNPYILMSPPLHKPPPGPDPINIRVMGGKLPSGEAAELGGKGGHKNVRGWD